VINQEIELIWMDMTYSRKTRSNGKVTSEVEGGLITACFATGPDTDQVLRWLTKESQDDTMQELDKMEKGKVCFYGDGFEYPPTKTYDFNDAFLVDYIEVFDSENKSPMQTVVTISPGIQDYGAEIFKPWNVSYIPPSEDIPHQSEEVVEKELVDYYLTDTSGTRIEEYEVGDSIILNIETKNRIYDKITIHL
jgi:hypothetical protein